MNADRFNETARAHPLPTFEVSSSTSKVDAATLLPSRADGFLMPCDVARDRWVPSGFANDRGGEGTLEPGSLGLEDIVNEDADDKLASNDAFGLCAWYAFICIAADEHSQCTEH